MKPQSPFARFYLTFLDLTGKLGPLFAFILVVGIFAILVPEQFFDERNFSNIIMRTVTIAIAAVGMTFIIVSAGIDLSVGSVVALTGTVSTMVIMQQIEAGSSVLAAISIGLLAGVLIGALTGVFNGMVIHYGMLPPFIVTLGMMEIARGTGLVLTGGNTIAGLPREFAAIANQYIEITPLDWVVLPILLYVVAGVAMVGGLFAFSLKNRTGLSYTLFFAGVVIWLTGFAMRNGLFIPYSLFVLIAVGGIASFVLRYTVFGKQVIAVGSNEKTAQLCGINVGWVKIGVYVLGGVTAGIAGILHASRLNTGQPAEAVGMELDVIAAVVIGGGSLMGGEGTVFGSIIGAFIIRILRNGCNLMGISSFTQRIVIGVIIILAVYLDQLRRKHLANNQ